MLLETIIICLTVYNLFADYIAATADLLFEEARRLQIENDIKVDNHAKNW